MKNVSVYEFKDLPTSLQEEVKKETIELEVESRISSLINALEEGQISEEECYETLGRSFDEPECYYEKHKEDVEERVEEILETSLFDKVGQRIFLD